MKHLILNSLLVVLLAGSGVALAEQMSGMNHAAMQNMGQDAAHEAVNQTTGLVNSIDMQQGTVNITHGPVKTLGWPGMTMNFKVEDKALLKDIKPGQKVKFEIVKEAPGKFYISHLNPLK